jgi:hypothetical protein
MALPIVGGFAFFALKIDTQHVGQGKVLAALLILGHHAAVAGGDQRAPVRDPVANHVCLLRSENLDFRQYQKIELTKFVRLQAKFRNAFNRPP